jgi:ribosomal protein S27E
MEKSIHELTTLIYLAIEVECKVCQKRFAEPAGNLGVGEVDVWRWAEKTAAAAWQSGWRSVEQKVYCPGCLGKNLVPVGHSIGGEAHH